MSLTSAICKTSGVFASSPQTIPTGFSFVQGAELVVLDSGSVGTPRDPPNVLGLGSDYTVTGGGYNALGDMQVGSIVVVDTGTSGVVAGDVIWILRGVPLTQITSFLSTGPLTAAMIEEALDKLTAIAQEQDETISRCLRFEQDESTDGTITAALRAGKVLAFGPLPAALPYFAPGPPTLAGDASAETVVATGSLMPRTLADRFADLVNVKNFGAVGDGHTDDTVAIQAAVDFAIATTTSPVFFPTGQYNISAAIVMDGAEGISLQGSGLSFDSVPPAIYRGPSSIMYTGAGAGAVISMVDTTRCRILGISILYSNVAYTGIVIDMRGVTKEPAENQIADCVIRGVGGATSAASLINITATDDIWIERCEFSYALIGIQGPPANFSGATNFANSITIRDCYFVQKIIGAAIQDAGTAWRVDGCTFEPNTAGALCIYRYTAGHTDTSGLMFLGCWAGDATVAGDAIQFQGVGLTIMGCHFRVAPINSNIVNLNGTAVMGVVIIGNDLSVGDPGYLLYSASGQHGHIIIKGNQNVAKLPGGYVQNATEFFPYESDIQNWASIANIATEAPYCSTTGPLAKARYVQTLNAGGVVSFNAKFGDIQVVTLNANASGSLIYSPTAGQVVTVCWIQGAAGSLSYVWPVLCKFAGGAAPTPSTAAGYEDNVTFRWNGANWMEISRSVAVH